MAALTQEPKAPSLEGWDIARVGEFDGIRWIPWGPGGKARAKILARADGYHIALVEGQPGYRTEPHVHEYAEFLYVISGTMHNQGVPMSTGDVFAASAGSVHSDFVADTAVTYLSIFKLPPGAELPGGEKA
ncbi:cupin domain-containing protein [Kitasatospora sp. NPDC056531]|uniref:cupin domain-containing protein n=1 Tax=Kitasatospora sp. NPDC056531 TaxID=3345856 RepID=UPI00368127F4